MKKKIVVASGLLWNDNTEDPYNIIGCGEGDRIAGANGFGWLEQLERKYKEAGFFYIDSETLVIIEDEK
jgi:hypothetical protein